MSFFKNLFQPNTIAVIGASTKKGKVGNVVYENLKQKFKTIPVNINTEGFGLFTKAYKSITDYEGVIDLAIICIPAKAVPSVLKDCADKGVKSVIIISAGFSEAGDEELKEEVKKICEDKGIKVLGPNCLGVINTRNELNASFFKGVPEYDSIAFVSQSGALGVAVLDEIITSGQGLSKFISVGNMLNTNFSHVVKYLNEDDDTSVVCAYVEGFRKGEKFLKVMKKVKKPVIVLKAGNTKRGSEAVNTHTGSLAGSERVYRGVFKQHKVYSVDSIEQMFTLARLLKQKKFKTRKVCILTNAGGPGVLATDACENQGLKVAKLPKKVKKRLNKILPSNWSNNNPVDVLGDAGSERYAKVLNVLKSEKFYDTLLCILTPQAMTEPEKTAKSLIKFSEKVNKKVFACFMGGDSVKTARELLKKSNIMNFNEPFEFAEVVSKSKFLNN